MATLTLETIEGDAVIVSIDDRTGNLCIHNRIRNIGVMNMEFTHEDWRRIETFVAQEYFSRAAKELPIEPPQHEDKE